MTNEELSALADLLNISQQTFEMLANAEANAGNVNGSNVFAARSRLSEIFASRLQILARIGEPESRDVH